MRLFGNSVHHARAMAAAVAFIASGMFASESVAQTNATDGKRVLATKLNTLLRGHVNANDFEATLFDQMARTLPKSENAENLEYKNKISAFRTVIRSELEIFLRESNSLRVEFFEKKFENSELEEIVKFFESGIGEKYRKIDQESSQFVTRQSETLAAKMSKAIDLKAKEIFGK